MLWLKAWLETRWKFVWLLLIGVLLLGVLETTRNVHSGDPQRLLLAPLAMSTFLAFIATVMLAGSGIQTASTRPGASQKGDEGSMLFTLSLPVTRTRLFVVRTVTGVLETAAFLMLVAAVVWLVAPVAVSVHDLLGYLAVIGGCSLAIYAMSACLSTFCDEGWRLRGSTLAFLAFYVLSAANALPRSINFFVPLVSASPLITHQIPWKPVVAACTLALAFLAAAMTIIEKRDY